MSNGSPIIIPPTFSPMTLRPLPSPQTVLNAIVPILEAAEVYGNSGYVFKDPVSGFDIGYGSQLNADNLPWILQAMGVAPAQIAAATAAVVSAMRNVSQLGALQSALNAAIGPYISGGEFRLLPDQAQSALQYIVQNITIPKLNTLLIGNGVSYLATPEGNNTQEYLALLDMYYAGGANFYGSNKLPRFSAILQALSSGDRAEVWFQIRYRSNGNHLPGLAKRRYWDAQLFGLFSNPGNPSQDEVLQAYQMLTRNRQAIIQYEGLYGADPDSTQAPGSNNMIAAGNDSYHLSGTPSELQTLAQVFAPAEAVLISMLVDRAPSLLGWLNNAPFARATDIFLASSSNPDVDPRRGDPAISLANVTLSAQLSAADALEAFANHILIGTGDGQTLTGGLGSDILVAGSGAETLIAGGTLDTIVGGSGPDTVVANGVGDTIDFEVDPDTTYKQTVIENSSVGKDPLYVNGRQIGSGMSLNADGTWTDDQGFHYQFQSLSGMVLSHIPAGFSPANAGSYIGVLEITGGSLGSNEIDVWGFNLQTAVNSGFDGISIPKAIVLTPGVTTQAMLATISSGNLASATLVAGQSTPFTATLLTPSPSAETITFTLTGGNTSGFSLQYGGQLIPFTGGSATVQVGAGTSSISAALVSQSSAGGNQTLQLVATASDPATSAPLTVNYVEPTPDPFDTPTTQTIIGQQGAYHGTPATYYDQHQPGLVNGANELIQAGPGLNHISSSLDGNDLIIGGGGHGVISAGRGNNHIYTGTQQDLQTAINAQSSPPAVYGDQQGYYIGALDGNNTIVSAAGNDLIMVGSGNNLIVAGVNDTVWGGESGDGAALDWSTVNYGEFTMWHVNALVQTDDVAGFAEGGMPPASYEGVIDISTGREVGTGNDTIFGGAGRGFFLLSNGNNYVETGLGTDVVYGGMGADTIIGGSGNISVTGGGGNDYLYGGSGRSLLIGQAGNNTIIGGSGNDTLFAGSNVPRSSSSSSDWGNSETGDNYVEGGSGNDLIFGAGGNDTLIAGSGNSTIYGGAGTEFIVGGSGNDSLVGGSGNDTLSAGGDGNDTLIAGGSATSTTVIYGGGGTDVILGGSGTNILYAGDGGVADAPTLVQASLSDANSTTTIYGGNGVDHLYGGAGTSVIYAGNGGTSAAPTQIVAGSGNVTAYGGLGTDIIQGGSGTDVLYAGDGGTDEAPTSVIAGSGAATLYGGAGVDILQDLTGGSDLLVGGSGTETLRGSGHDTLIAGSGSDYFIGGGNETFVFNAGSGDVYLADGTGSTLDFGSGIAASDLNVTGTLTDSGTAVLEIDDGSSSIIIQGGLTGSIAAIGFAGQGSMSLVQFMKLAGSDQTIRGSNGEIIFNIDDGALLAGGAGSDTIAAAGDADTIAAGAGGAEIDALGAFATILGGLGQDTITARGAYDVITAGAGGDQITSSGDFAGITGTTGPDTITASGLADTIRAGAAGEQITSSGAYAQIYGGSGRDTIVASGDSAVITAGTAGDQITVSGNYSRVIGGSGADVLAALGTNDTLYAGNGLDTLIAGTGDTLLQGVAGTTYVFDSGFGADRVSADGGAAHLVFGQGIAVSDLTLSATSGANGQPALLIRDGNGAITVNGGIAAVSSFQFADGASFNTDSLLARVHVEDATVAGSPGNLILDGASNISVMGGDGNDTIYAAGSNDTLVAGSGDQELHGVGSGEVLAGGLGNDTLWGGSGDDTLVAGAGATTLIGGQGIDTYELTQGGTARIQPGSKAGLQIMYLPNGMSMSSFTSYKDGSSLILASLDGQTHVTIGNYFTSGVNKLWLLASDRENPVLLNDWLAGQSGGSGGTGGSSDYASEIASLLSSSQASLAVQLNQLGEAGHSLGTLLDVPWSNYLRTPVSSYTFNGVTRDVLSVTGGALQIPSSQSGMDQIQTITTTTQVTVPVYAWVIVPGGFEKYVPFEDIPAGMSIPPNWVPYLEDGGYDSHGQKLPDILHGYFVMLPDTRKLVQTGTITKTITNEDSSDISTRSFTQYAVTGDSGNDNITSAGPFAGSVVLGDGNNYVNLGTTSATEADWIGGHYPGTSVPLFSSQPAGAGYFNDYEDGSQYAIQPGAFIQAGNGNDTLIGTDGNDSIAAGLGFDSLDGGRGGDTYYVAMQGYSTDIISDSGDPSGNLMSLLVGGSSIEGPDVTEAGYGGEYRWAGPGAFPLDTLVLPSGIKPSDLSYRVFQDPTNPALQTLQLMYGTSSVLIHFAAPPSLPGVPRDPVHWSNVGHEALTTPASIGVDLFRFADGTVLTRDQLLAQASLLPNDFNPVVREANLSLLQAGQQVAASTLFTVTDAPDDAITWYRFSDNGAGGGYFLLNGQRESSGQPFMINAGQLADLSYVAGASRDAITVSAFDGAVWSTLYQASAPDQLIAGPATGPATLVGGYGGDTLAGSSGQDTFIYDAGSGAEIIAESAAHSATSHNTLKFGPGITPASLSLSLSGSGELMLSVGSNGDSVALERFDALDPLQSTAVQQFAFADGSTLSLVQLLGDSHVTGSSGTLAHTDGTSTSYAFDTSGSQIYTASTLDAQGNRIARAVIDPDGSQEYQTFDAQRRLLSDEVTHSDGSSGNATYRYAADGSYSVTLVSTPSDGSGVTTTVDTYDPRGNRTGRAVSTPDGSTEHYTYNSQGQTLTDDLTYSNGATNDKSFAYNADGSFVRSLVATVPWEPEPTTTVDHVDAQGNILSENIYRPAANGSYRDDWSNADGSHGSYWWNASSGEYQQSWFNSDGSSWYDDYLYQAGGSPANPGSSFTEFYLATDGSSGARRYDATTGTTSIDWTSSATGSLSGTTSDSGFLGLQGQDAVTNTQPDLTFFNPNVSAGFHAFLTSH